MTDDDPLRALDTLDRYGWRVRWVTDLGADVLTVSARQLVLVDSSITRPEAEGVLLRVMAREDRSRPALQLLLPSPEPCWARCPNRRLTA